MSSIIESSVTAIRAQVGDGRAICGLSGGVDSAVAAALVHRAIGAQLTCVFVDTGLMREGEGEQVVETFQRHQGIELIHVRAADRFFERLEGVIDPEEKRKTIGELFIRVFEDAAGGLDRRPLPGAGHALPRRHRVGHQPGGQDQEPPQRGRPARGHGLRAGRAAAQPVQGRGARSWAPSSACPTRSSGASPSPGPGLGVRIIGEVTPDKVAILQRADAIVREEIRLAGLEREIWQAFAVLPDIRSVGVMGDERTYGYPVIIRAVTSEDAMTADWARLPYDLLERLSSRIINEVPGVNRVAYDITSKPPGTIEWE